MVMMIRWSQVFPYKTITFNITEWIQTEQQPNTYSRSYFRPCHKSVNFLHSYNKFVMPATTLFWLARCDLFWWFFDSKLRPVDLLIVFPGNGVFLIVSRPNSPWFCRWPPVAFPQTSCWPRPPYLINPGSFLGWCKTPCKSKSSKTTLWNLKSKMKRSVSAIRFWISLRLFYKPVSETSLFYDVVWLN